MEQINKLKRRLSSRHIQFMTFGSVIGTGFFYGSADTIKMAGPSVLLSYIISGISVYIIMRALGEMLVYNPSNSSFPYLAKKNLCPFAGYIIGWTYCFEILIVAIVDAITFGVYMNAWFPDIPNWIWIIIIVLIICFINLMSVKVFGEVEFWFSIFKIIAIIIMIVAGFGVIFLGIGNTGNPTGIHNLWSNGGFFGNGYHGLMMSLQMAIFSYGGIEIISLAAEEVKNPEKSLSQAINVIPIQILVCYVSALFVIMSICPWNQIGTNGSPFVLTFKNIGNHFVSNFFNCVVISSSISAINSNVFGIGRVLYSMAQQGFAPRVFIKTSCHGIPWITVLATTGTLLFAIYLNCLIPRNVFLVISSLATFSTIWIWIMILLSQIAFRQRLLPIEVKTLKFRMPGGAVTTSFNLVFLIFIISMIYYRPDTRISLYAGFSWIGFLLIIWIIKHVIDRR